VRKAALTQACDEAWLALAILFALSLILIPLLRREPPPAKQALV
jgi:hypothetical protein